MDNKWYYENKLQVHVHIYMWIDSSKALIVRENEEMNTTPDYVSEIVASSGVATMSL